MTRHRGGWVGVSMDGAVVVTWCKRAFAWVCAPKCRQQTIQLARQLPCPASSRTAPRYLPWWLPECAYVAPGRPGVSELRDTVFVAILTSSAGPVDRFLVPSPVTARDLDIHAHCRPLMQQCRGEAFRHLLNPIDSATFAKVRHTSRPFSKRFVAAGVMPQFPSPFWSAVPPPPLTPAAPHP